MWKLTLLQPQLHLDFSVIVEGFIDNICNTDAWTGAKTFQIFQDLISQQIVPFPSDFTVCEGLSVSATFTNGSGGPPSLYTVYEYRIDGGSWLQYISSTPISTTGAVRLCESATEYRTRINYF